MLFTKRKHKVDAKKLKKSQIKAVSAEDMKKLKQANDLIDDENDDIENENGVIKKPVYKSSILLKDTEGKVRIFKATIVEDK